jgi:hypothetical protein
MKLSSGKLQFWECKKLLVDDETFYSSPILGFYIPTCRKRLPCFRRADAGKFRKSLKIKMAGKTAGNSPHGEGRAST